MSDSPSIVTTPSPLKLSATPGDVLLLLGVVLPLVTLGVELTTRMNSETFFDPLPTVFHVFLVGLVPLANLWVWVAVRSRNPAHLGKIVMANGCAIGVALFYTILFLPILPIGAIGIIFFGLGLLPLTPLIALVAAIRFRIYLIRFAVDAQLPIGPLWPGVLATTLALVALELPATVTRIGAQMAKAESPQTSARGIAWLRAVGSNDLLLRLCYVRSGVATDMLGFVAHMAFPVFPEDARKIYYRVNGTPFNAVPAPVPTRLARNRLFGRDDVDFDQGGDRVATRFRGLSLAASRLDGSLDANAAVGYLEWTMVFRNDAQIQREARAQIGLPPGATVSRLTLWIDGEEREAAFAGRGKVRQAYESIVRRNRDPVLVTSAGKDRVAMQLFPVPANGEMKVRVGITLPMTVKSKREAAISLPYFHERNFDVPERLRHAVWIESKAPLRDAFVSPSPAERVFVLRAELDDTRLGLASPWIVAERDPRVAAWAPDDRAKGELVLQTLREHSATVPKRLVVVVDGSRAMREAAPQVAKALAGLPPTIDLELIFAEDQRSESRSGDRLTAPAMAERIEKFDYIGGRDNVAALARGLDSTFAQDGAALLWVHGPQPVLLEPAESLLQRLERRPGQPPWYDLQVTPGSNMIGEKLDGLARMVSLRRDDLPTLISTWHPGAARLVATRERVNSKTAALREEEKTSDHLIRLWAHDEIGRLTGAGTQQKREEAIELARQYQLVTAVSGAVVLETRQQYEGAGLEPVPPGSVPTIPEPETWALLAVVMLVLGWAYRRRRRERTHAAFAV